MSDKPQTTTVYAQWLRTHFSDAMRYFRRKRYYERSNLSNGALLVRIRREAADDKTDTVDFVLKHLSDSRLINMGFFTKEDLRSATTSTEGAEPSETF